MPARCPHCPHGLRMLATQASRSSISNVKSLFNLRPALSPPSDPDRSARHCLTYLPGSEGTRRALTFWIFFFPFAQKIDFWPNKSVNIYNIFFLISCKYRSSEMQLKKKTQQKLLVLALSFQWSETECGREGGHKMSPAQGWRIGAFFGSV